MEKNLPGLIAYGAIESRRLYSSRRYEWVDVAVHGAPDPKVWVFYSGTVATARLDQTESSTQLEVPKCVAGTLADVSGAQ
jgi:hypothetical protein